MKITTTCIVAIFILHLYNSTYAQKNSQSKTRPNIVIIYADDMGYGDLNCQNPNSKIPTPNIDQLATEGMRFTDAHSSSAICSPSRFAMLTGQYHWRRTHGIVKSFGDPLFKDTDVTLPQLLKSEGYETAAIGKWHLGWNWNFINKEPSGERTYWGRTHKTYLVEDINWEAPLKGGPLDRGFDYYFGDGTINFPPYAWVENDKFVKAPNDFFEFNQFEREAKEIDWDSRPGPKVAGWNPYTVLPTLTKKTVAWIDEQKKDKPFFLYLALPSPHAPIIPNDEFDGTSQAGAYGDFVVQTDWVAGQVLKALKRNGFDENTLVIFSSDNGPEKFAYERAEKFDHYSMGDFRGLKRDLWEGGHHIPFVIKWPNHINPGTVSDDLISQIDVMATLLDITETKIPEKGAIDSQSFLPIITGESNHKHKRTATIHNTNPGRYAVRMGKWLYINYTTGSVGRMPESFKKLRGYTDFTTEGLLFDLEKDPEQRINLFETYPEKIKEMEAYLQQELDRGYLN
ncbi:arylsulfatase [Arenibacter aquaticus]|uniref:Arylsulfatase n=1 Tax=Arenibacter aquaticus TaxID=2489054 RepID=A0A3S0AN44_9FLAO|nr:arylsulfatase [Arenibacter aquaticus]RTE53917.1 arylsulfatase [Arenibacter aquaticus]